VLNAHHLRAHLSALIPAQILHFHLGCHIIVLVPRFDRLPRIHRQGQLLRQLRNVATDTLDQAILIAVADVDVIGYVAA
jgi:hypothetical protein